MRTTSSGFGNAFPGQLPLHACPVARCVTRWGAMNSIPEKHGASLSSMDLPQEPASPEDSGSWTGVIFLALVLVAAILFTVYVLAWDGGGHT